MYDQVVPDFEVPTFNAPAPVAPAAAPVASNTKKRGMDAYAFPSVAPLAALPADLPGYAAKKPRRAGANGVAPEAVDDFFVPSFDPTYFVPGAEAPVAPAAAPQYAAVPGLVTKTAADFFIPAAMPAGAARPAEYAAKKGRVAATPKEVGPKPRWESPLRRGNWAEPWESAAELAEGAVKDVKKGKVVSGVVRSAVSQLIVKSVGLPVATVDKWLQLLAEYLELNADEHIVMACLLRKYIMAGKSLVGENDWSRPQRWECVVAIACYLAVLLSEEFPCRTANDLRELLGSQFKFGTEQVEFLRAVNWRINIDADEFQAASALFLDPATPLAALTAWIGAPATAAKPVIKTNPTAVHLAPAGAKKHGTANMFDAAPGFNDVLGVEFGNSQYGGLAQVPAGHAVPDVFEWGV